MSSRSDDAPARGDTMSMALRKRGGITLGDAGEGSSSDAKKPRQDLTSASASEALPLSTEASRPIAATPQSIAATPQMLQTQEESV
jgi:hypothetical protein